MKIVNYVFSITKQVGLPFVRG